MKLPQVISRALNGLRSSASSYLAPTPYAAGDHESQEMANWHPNLGSADSDYNPSRDKIVSRTRDISRNSGWAKSGLDRHVDNVIGSGWRLSSKPDYMALGLDAKWASKWSDEVEGRWRLFASDPDFYIDASRNDDFNGLLRIAYKQRFRDGEALALALWDEDKPDGRYATTIQLIDTDRLSNPYRQPDSEFMRGGVEINARGAAIAYHFSRAHPADAGLSFVKASQWDRVLKEDVMDTHAGTIVRRRVIHGYEKDRPSMNRGVSAFASVLGQVKMLHQYDNIEIQRAIVDASISTYLQSPMDHEFLAAAIDDDNLSKYQDARSAFHGKRKTNMMGVRIPTLFPGEEIKMITRSSPSSSYEGFVRAGLRKVAAGLGISYEQMTQDWSQVNYSSARAAMIEIWKSMESAREDFSKKFATPIFMLWLQEAIYRGDIQMPAGAPDFETAKAAYGKCDWIGMGRGYVDPEKEASASNMRMNNMTSTLEKECAEQGQDWKENLQQRAREKEEMIRLGLDLPDWATNPAARQLDRQQPENAE